MSLSQSIMCLPAASDGTVVIGRVVVVLTCIYLYVTCQREWIDRMAPRGTTGSPEDGRG